MCCAQKADYCSMTQRTMLSGPHPANDGSFMSGEELKTCTNCSPSLPPTNNSLKKMRILECSHHVHSGTRRSIYHHWHAPFHFAQRSVPPTATLICSGDLCSSIAVQARQPVAPFSAQTISFTWLHSAKVTFASLFFIITTVVLVVSSLPEWASGYSKQIRHFSCCRRGTYDSCYSIYLIATRLFSGVCDSYNSR